MKATPDLYTVRAFLDRHLPRGIPVEHLKLARFKTDPTKGFLLLYKLEASGVGGEDFYVSARSLTPSKGRKIEERMNRELHETPSRGAFPYYEKAVIYSDDLHLLFQMFPVDRYLPFLVKAADPQFMRSAIEQMCRRNGEERTLDGVNISVVKYSPERRCLFRYQLDWKGARGRTRMPQVLYGKVFRNPQKMNRSLEEIRAAWKGTIFKLPEAIGVLPDISTQFFSHLPGVSLSRICSEKRFPGICRKVAIGLLEFHNTPVVFNKRGVGITAPSYLKKWSDEFVDALPEQAECIRNITMLICDALSRQEAIPLKPVHGDFHVANILVDGENLGLIDFEECFMGHPAFDVGFFYAQLKLLSLKVFNDHTSLDASIGRFIEEYMQGAPPAYRDAIQAYGALSCLWCAYFQCLRRPFKPGWAQRTLIMLNICEEVLRRGL